MDKSLFLVFAVGLMSLQGCPEAVFTPTSTASTVVVHQESVTIADPTVETQIGSETGDYAYALVLPANALPKGKKITVSSAFTPPSAKIPAAKLQDEAVKNGTLLLYLELGFFGDPLKAGITTAGFALPQPGEFPKDSTALLLYYNRISKAWEEAASFISDGTSINLFTGSIAKAGAYCLFTQDVVSTPTPTPTITPSPTPTITPSPTPTITPTTTPTPTV